MFKRILDNKPLLLKTIVMVTISFLYIGRSLNDFDTPFTEGDGQEYVLTTEAICNHFSPDVRSSDVESYKSKFDKVYGWKNNYLRETQDKQISLFKSENHPFKGTIGGLYFGKDKKWYSQHFVFYSYLNAPFYKLFSAINPVRPFYFFNAILVILVCFILLFKTPFTTGISILAALCFCFSSAYWYLNWEHAEILTMCLVALGMVNFFNKKGYLSLLFIALACLQNQPLTILFGFMALVILIEGKFAIKKILIIFSIGLITLIPGLYFFLKFETTNLIKDSGFLDTMFITHNRVFGFYFDVNQGMILTIPLILLTYIVVLIGRYYKIFKDRKINDYSGFLPFVVIIMSITVSTMGNWNHGMAIINRYATWMSVIVMIHLFYLIHELKYKLTEIILFNYLFCSQCFTTLYHQQFNEYDWSSAYNTPLAKWFYKYHPTLYNPDPMIFAGRLRVNLTEDNSPIIYFNNRAPKKILVHKKHIDDLSLYGVSKENITKIKSEITFNYDWGYVDKKLFKGKLTNEEVYNIKRQKKIEAVKMKIMQSEIWSNQIREKVKVWGKSFEEGINIDAEYMVLEEERKQIDD